MANSIQSKFSKILIFYNDLGEKKILKTSLKDLSIDKKVRLFYSKNKHIPICALPRLRFVLASKQGFVSFCYNFFAYIDSTSTTNNITISSSNIKSIAKFVISHEVGHILDPTIYDAKTQYGDILSKLIDKLIEYDIDINDSNLHKMNLPVDLEECVMDLKRNLIDRESKAWDIAKTIVVIENSKEEYLFNKIREYALATYNYGNLKNIVKEHNIDVLFKYKRYLS